MTLSPQEYANLASDSYNPPPLPDRNKKRYVEYEGIRYEVLEHMDRSSGYQGTIYQRPDTGDIVVAHRGTEPKLLEPILKDGVVTDGAMVFDRTNPQLTDAIELTQHAVGWSKRLEGRYDHPLEVSVTGHSLGGCLAQVTAHRFGLRGETYNAYGAVSLNYGVPEGGDNVINHVMAADPVSAAGRHYGEIRVYATPKELSVLDLAGKYDNDRSQFDSRTPIVAAVASAGSHGMHHFTNRDANGRGDLSVLSDPAARKLAETFDPMIDKYRSDIRVIRGAASLAGDLNKLPREVAESVNQALHGRAVIRPEHEARDHQSGPPASLKKPEDGPGEVRPPWPGHPDYPMFSAIRAKFPDSVSDDKVMHATLLAKKEGIHPDRVETFTQGGNAWIAATFPPGYRVKFDLTEPVPPLAESMKQSQAFDMQQAQQREREPPTQGNPSRSM